MPSGHGAFKLNPEEFVCRGCGLRFPWSLSGEERRHLTLCRPCYQKQGWNRRGKARAFEAALSFCVRCRRRWEKHHDAVACRCERRRLAAARQKEGGPHA